MVRFSALILFMACLSVVMYFMGSPNVATQVQANGALGINIQVVVLGAISAAILAAVISYNFLNSGFAMIYIIPIALITAVLGYFVLPLGDLLNPAILDPALGTPIFFLFNVLTILAVMDFIKGGA